MPLAGFIKLHRSLLEWEWHDDPNTLSVWIHLLLKANFKPTEWRGIILQPGQLITSRASLAKETGLSEREIRTAMNRLKTSGCMTIETTSKYTLISINNFMFFQGIQDENDQKTDQQNDQQATSERPANDQPATNERPANDHSVRRKECEEGKNTVDSARKRFTPPSIEEAISYFSEKGESSSEAQRFFDYYTSNGWRVGKNPMKDWRAAASGWISRNRNACRSPSPTLAKGLHAVPTAEEYSKGVDPSGFGWA